MFLMSEPASGSVNANAQIAAPAATLGSSARRSASPPAIVTGFEPRPCITKAVSSAPLSRASHCRIRQIGVDSSVGAAPPKAPGTTQRSSPASASRRT
jgi:hypothetical protein